MSFQIGDKVIYPNHGLGVVEKVEEKTILGTTTGFFHLRIIANETTVLVPVANVDNVGLRRAITDEEVEQLFGLLCDGRIDNHQNWKGRFKDNSDKMRTGSIYDMADVLKSLTFLAKSKSLSFREKRMLDRAKALIISEISEVMRVNPAVIEERVNEALEKCFVTKAQSPAQPPIPRQVAPPRPDPVPAPVAAKPVAVEKPKAAVVAPRPVEVKPVAKVAAKPVAVKTAAKPAAKVVAKPTAVKAAKPAARPATRKAVKPAKVVAKAVAKRVPAKAKAVARRSAKPARQARAS